MAQRSTEAVRSPDPASLPLHCFQTFRQHPLHPQQPRDDYRCRLLYIAGPLLRSSGHRRTQMTTGVTASKGRCCVLTRLTSPEPQQRPTFNGAPALPAVVTLSRLWLLDLVCFLFPDYFAQLPYLSNFLFCRRLNIFTFRLKCLKFLFSTFYLSRTLTF